MVRCKAPEILRNEAYFAVAAMTKDEGNVADGRFSATCQGFFNGLREDITRREVVIRLAID